MATTNYNWSELHHNLLVEIVRRVKLYDDFISFGQVCTSWRSAAVLENFSYKTNIPWLMLPPKKDCNDKDKDVCSFFGLYNGTSLNVILPTFNSSNYYSSRGWLVKIDRDFSVNLLHPFSRAQLQLPPISSVEDWIDETVFDACICKCVVSSSTPDSSLVVMVIYGGRGNLAYAKPDDEVWTRVQPWNCRCFDVIYYKNQFYTIDTLGQIFAIKGDIAHKVAEIPNGLVPRNIFEYLYLVESEPDGALLVVSREGVQIRPIHEDSEEYTYGTTGFQVFEVDLSSNKWKEIKNLGSKCLFLGHNSSLSIDASNDPYCKRNSIYFTDDCIESYFIDDSLKFYDYMIELEHKKGGGKDMGIYNIGDGRIVPHYGENSYHFLNPPMWVEQS